MPTTPIFLLAPAAGMDFIAMPSGTTYVSSGSGLVTVTNGSVADTLALVAAGCAVLEPNAGGSVSTQPGTVYTLQSSDQNDAIVFTAASVATVTLPNSLPAGFAVKLYQGGAGQVSTIAASGATLVTPNLASTTGQYCALVCIVLSNTSGANAQWDVICVGGQVGAGLVGASTLASLYTQDGAAHYSQYSIAQIFSDFTPANDGFWLKTGTGNGSGNWTQQSSISLTGLNAQVLANSAALAALNATSRRLPAAT